MNKEKQKKEIGTRTDARGQIEMTVDETPLYKASERLVLTRAAVIGAKKELELAENTWCDEMKAIRKTKINHNGDIIQYVKGKTTEDHARFVKA